MATTQEVLEAARRLGRLLREHEARQRLAEVSQALEADADATRLAREYDEHLQMIADKERRGSPIEVEDKRKTESLRQRVASHPLLQRVQMVQMDYMDLVRKVDALVEDPDASP